MSQLFSPPLPNEHIYSWLLRLYKLSSFEGFSRFQKSLGIQDSSLDSSKVFSHTTKYIIAEYGSRYDVICNNSTLPLWQLTLGQEFTYGGIDYSSFNHMAEKSLFGFDTSWHSCPICREEDFKKFGISYWHAAHQIQSVYACYKHNTILQMAAPAIYDISSEQLPNNKLSWELLPIADSEKIAAWQTFVFNIHQLCIENPSEIVRIHTELNEFLGLKDQSLVRKNEICILLNREFESTLGEELLKYLFYDYSRPTRRGKPNIIKSGFAETSYVKGIRNPIYWLALCFWQRDRLGI